MDINLNLNRDDIFFDKRSKLVLYQMISKSGLFEKFKARDFFIDYLNTIWDLKSMRSTDNRSQFKNLEDDLIQHCVNNPDDYTDDDVFLRRLNLVDGDNAHYIKWLEETFNGKYYVNRREINDSLKSVDNFINDLGFELYLFTYDRNGMPVYKLKKFTDNPTPIDIVLNTITFYVDKTPTGRTDRASNHKKPETFPSFLLAYDGGWDDFKICSLFDAYYYDGDGTCHTIGKVKIIDKTDWDKDDWYYIKDYIPDTFTVLSSNFCSLGQERSYYKRIKELFPENYKSILWALKDCAMFPVIEEEFSPHVHFSSLIRTDTALELIDDVDNIMDGIDTKYYYQFTYNFSPKPQKEPIDLLFNFNEEGLFPNRLFTVIGENGVGKTQLIARIPLDISNSEKKAFSPYVPRFKKVMAVSYSYYDNFEIPNKNSALNYVYCGLVKQKEKDKTETYSQRELRDRMVKQLQIITKVNSKFNTLTEILKEMFPEIVNDLIVTDEDGKRNLNLQEFMHQSEIMSSGQKAFLYVFIDVISNIRTHSLILFDEPESHLHPAAITSFMNATYRLLEEFHSFGIIVTHSPMIVREMLSRNVYVLKRVNGIVEAGKIGIESFGENISILENEIFGKQGIEPYYKKLLRKLLSEGIESKEIEENIKTGKIPLSFNLNMMIESLKIANNNAEN